MTLAQRARDVDQVRLFRLALIGIYPFLQSCKLNHNVHRRRMDDFVLRMHRNHFTRAPLDLPTRTMSSVSRPGKTNSKNQFHPGSDFVAHVQTPDISLSFAFAVSLFVRPVLLKFEAFTQWVASGVVNR